MNTERLYFTDSTLLEFEAAVTAVRPSNGVFHVILDRTAFYPTGGGQPYDTGTLDGLTVIDVSESDEGDIIHVVNDIGRLAVGGRVKGIIDADRRRDHLQQHSGQHILSQAFIEACGAETRSFHLGSVSSTIDIALDSPDDRHMRAAEDVANRIIFENRPMRVHLVNEEEAARLPLRKESAVSGTIRVIEVEDFDWSPCGGTHANRTGEIGLITIKSFERAKRLTRVEFLCGMRALRDYRLANQTAYKVANALSVERDESPEAVTRLIQEGKAQRKRIRELNEITARVEASELLASAKNVDGFKLITAVFEGRDSEEMRLLAHRLIESEPAVALLGSKEPGMARIVFARSGSLELNMGKLVSDACAALGGKGGGKPDLAQGGGPDAEKLEEAIRLAASKLTGRID